MTAWLFILIVSGGVLLIAWRSKSLPAGALPMLAAVFALAGAGYAWQGAPELQSAPAQSSEDPRKTEFIDALIKIRVMMDRNFGPHIAPLVLSDSLMRNGNYSMGLAVLSGALKRYPDNIELKDAYALALFLAAEGRLTPAVKLSFEQARKDSVHPGPDYFEGLGYLAAQEPEKAEELWVSALAKGTPKGEWRPMAQAQLESLQQILARRETSRRLTGDEAGEQATGNTP